MELYSQEELAQEEANAATIASLSPSGYDATVFTTYVFEKWCRLSDLN